MRIPQKVVLITGASEGIGAACAAEFAARGARVSLTARSEEGLRKAAPSGALITAADLTDEAARLRVVDRTLEQFGAIDILINNAGVGFYQPSWRSSMETTRRMMELNFFAALGMIQLVIPSMRARRSGMIVNIGSIGGELTLPWLTLYSASKAAVAALTQGLRMELRADGVHAMLVCPGYVKTGFQKNVLAAGEPPAAVKRMRQRAITAEECAKAIRRGVERDARTVVTPAIGWLGLAAMRVAPGVVESRLARMNETA